MALPIVGQRTNLQRIYSNNQRCFHAHEVQFLRLSLILAAAAWRKDLRQAAVVG
ncbi:MAG: hypothetical protein ACI9PU_002598 [Ascidiaceihabitans sp.]|jgi:hypothetical protein